MWFYFLSHLIECAVRVFSIYLGQEWTLSPLDVLLPELWKHNLSFLSPCSFHVLSPCLCFMHCLLYFSHTNDLSVLSIIFLFTCSTVLNMLLPLLSFTHLCVFLSLPSFLISYTSLFWISLFLHHPLVWSDLCAISLILTWVTFSPHSVSKIPRVTLFSVTFQDTLHFVCSR